MNEGPRSQRFRRTRALQLSQPACPRGLERPEQESTGPEFAGSERRPTASPEIRRTEEELVGLGVAQRAVRMVTEIRDQHKSEWATVLPQRG